MIISLDCEATGLDLAHGARPFLVTTCNTDGLIRFWEWDVDPYTRRPDIPEPDIGAIADLIDSAELIYLQNAKFDARALLTIGICLPWSKVRDTLVMGHLLASNHRHDLTSMCVEYLGVDIEHHELLIKEVTQKCRAIVRRDYQDWKIAREGLEGMPSVQGGSKRDDDKPWKNDMWLPRALRLQYLTDGNDTEVDANWVDACAKYANADSESTLYLGLEMERLIRERGLWKIYEHRLQLPRIACEMETYGVTAIGFYTESTIQEYEEHCAESTSSLQEIAGEYGHQLELAQGAALNDNMRDFFYGSVWQSCPRCGKRWRIKHWLGEKPLEWCPKCLKGSSRCPSFRITPTTTRRDNLKLPMVRNAKSKGPSLDKDTMQEYLHTLDGTPLEFVRLLLDKRGFDTALSYMEAYRRFWVPVTQWVGTRSGDDYAEVDVEGFYRIHPSLNPCGTDHLRWSSNSPNCQNVSKKDDYNLRSCFGPAPGREWWSMDFKNIELRIPAYESGEESMIEIFEKGEVEPYWGSYHNLVASIVYRQEYFEVVCPECLGIGCKDKNSVPIPCLPKSSWVPLSTLQDGFKKRYKSTLYQWIKNFNFARIYGCGVKKGDATARKSGACAMVDRGLPKLAKLQAYYLRQAEKTGFVQTLPDRGVDPTRGYPILASRTDDGRVLSTTPFNYHVSGTACWVKNRALEKCSAQLDHWRRVEGFDGHISLEIHDEILFDFPRGATPEENWGRALILRGLMERCGDDLIPAIPTPVSAEYHDTNWAKGVTVQTTLESVK